MLLAVTIFLTARGRAFIDGFDFKTLIILHAVRIPVEIVLFWLFLHKLMPQLMTIEGRNFDILSGLSAPEVYYFAFIKNKLGTKHCLPGTLFAWQFYYLLLAMQFYPFQLHFNNLLLISPA